jgi:hypothetical protein
VICGVPQMTLSCVTTEPLTRPKMPRTTCPLGHVALVEVPVPVPYSGEV